MAGPLVIRFASDVEPVKRAMTQAASVIASNMSAIARSSALASDAMQGHWLKVATQVIGTSALLKIGFAGIALAAVASINQAIASVERYNEIAEKAAKLDVSTTFFQAFLAQAQSLRAEANDLERALQNAYKAGQPLFEEQQPVRKRLGEIFESGYTGDFQSQGLKAFDAAKTAEERTRAIAVAMRELEDLGLRLGSLDIASRFFGPDFAEKMRQTGTTAKQFLSDLDAAAAKPDIIKQRDIDQAKQLHDRMQEAKKELEEALRISDFLAASGREIYGVWVTIVEVIARAAKGLSEYLSLAPSGSSSRIGTATIEATIVKLQTQLQDPGKTGQQRSGLEEQLRKAYADLATTDLKNGEGIPAIAPYDLGATGQPPVPMPRRLPLEIALDRWRREQKQTQEEGPDPFDRQADSINRHIAALQADAAAVGMTTAAHEQLRVETRLLEAARQSGTEISDDQIAQYAKLRQTMDAQSALTAAHINLNEDDAKTFVNLSGRIRETVDVLEKARNSFQGMNEALRFGGNQLVDVIDRATQKGAKFGDIMEDVFNNLKRQMLQAALTGEGALAKLFGLNSTVPGGVGGLLGALGKLGGFDEGGYTGNAGTRQVTGVVHGQEYVFDAAATRRIGVPALRALQRGDIGFFSGGFTGGPSGSSSARGYGGTPNIRFNIQNNGASVSQPTVRRDSDGGFTFDMIVDAVEGKIAGNAMGNRGPMSDAIKSVSHGQNGWG